MLSNISAPDDGPAAKLRNIERLASLLKAHPKFEEVRRQIARLEERCQRFVTGPAPSATVWRRWGAGPNLVMIHGAYGSWLHWIANIESLANTFTVWVPDLPGFGDSPISGAADNDLDGCGAAMAAQLEQLAGRGARFSVAGFSFGCKVAADLAHALPGQATRLVVVAPGGFSPRSQPLVTPVKWRGITDIDELLRVQRFNLGAIMLADQGRIDDLALYSHTLNNLLARGHPSRPARWSMVERLQKVQTPLGMIWGTEDVYHRSHLQSRTEDLRGIDPKLRGAVIDGAGHWVMYEAPAAFRAALLRILEP